MNNEMIPCKAQIWKYIWQNWTHEKKWRNVKGFSNDFEKYDGERKLVMEIFVNWKMQKKVY